MKRKILLLMMTALLSVGAWAEEVWKGTFVASGWGVIQDVTFLTDLTTNDVIRLTVNIDNGFGYAIALCKKDGNGGTWSGTVLAEVTYQNDLNDSGDRIIEIPVTNDIINAIKSASGLLTFNGQSFTMTSVDIARNTGGLTILTSGEASTWGCQKIQSRFISYASVGDVIEVTASRKSDEWGGEVYIKDGAEKETANVLGSGDLGDYGSEVPAKISVTAPMLAETNLYLWGGYYDISSVKLMFTHDVTIAGGITNGTVTASKSKAAYGETVTLTAAPAAGYALVKPTVTDENSGSLTVTDNGNGTYSFTMPATAVTVNATFTSATALSTDRLIIYNQKNGSIAPEGDYRNLWVDDEEYPGWDLTVGRPVTTDEFAGIQVLYRRAMNIKMQVTYGVNGVWTSDVITGEEGSSHILSVNFADEDITGVVKSIKFFRNSSTDTMIQFESTDAVSLKTKEGASAPTPTSSLTLTYETLEDGGGNSVTKVPENSEFTITEGAGHWAGWIFTLPIPTTLYKGVNFNMTSVPENGAIEIVYEGGATQTLKLKTGNNIVNFVHGGNITQIKFNVAGTYRMGECSASNTYLAKVTSDKYATYGAVNDAIDYSATSGLTAYIAKVENDVVKLTKVTKVPANTAVVLYAETAGTYTLSTATGTTDNVSANELHVSDGTVTGDGIYVLANKNNVVGFYKLQNSVKVPAGKAYLVVSSGVRQFIGFGDNATGIDNIEHSTPHIEQHYDLQGRRVAQPTKGLYIVNGKKVIIK